MIKKFICILVTIISVMSMTVSSFANTPNIQRDDKRTVFTTDGVDMNISYYNFDGIKYIPVVFANATAKYGTKVNYKGESANYFTVEEVDGYTGKSGYYTIWQGSKKLRISGKDSSLKYPAYVLSVPDYYVFVSVDDWCKIYGYDMSYWAAKNTIYFKRNGKGLL